MSATARAEARFEIPPIRPASWARQAVGSFVAAQKILLDLTAQQNALIIGIIRERLSRRRIRIGETMVNAAGKTVAGFTGAGKILLDLAAGEAAIIAEAAKEGFRLSPGTSAVADVLCNRVDTIIDMEKRVLDAAAEQTQAMIASYHEGKGLSGGASFSELAQRGIIGFVETEKKFLDMVAEEVTAAAEGGKEPRKPAKDRSKALTKLARQGVDDFIEAQKKLLDLAIHQLENGETAKTTEEPEEDPGTTFADLTQRSVQNLVAAQKSLMDLAIKPLQPAAAGPAATHRKAGRRPARKR